MAEDRPLRGSRPDDDCLSTSSDSIEPVELLADDFKRRRGAGENPTIDEYCAKHPELADEIREVFPALVVIEQVVPESADLQISDSPLESPDHRLIEKVGDYRILRELGRGGMGVVYEAEQESLGRRVALKVLPRHAAGDQKALLRFQREARAAAKLHHTNIVPVFEVGHDKEYSYYAMQLIQGQGLDHVINDLLDIRSQRLDASKGHPAPSKPSRVAEPSLAASLVSGHFQQQKLTDNSDNVASSDSELESPFGGMSLTETLIQATGSTTSATLPGHSDVSTAEDNRSAYFRSVAEIGYQCARALSYAHARGITHRDIKPSNLLLDTAGVVWITDFGLARTSDSSMTQTGDILGTIRYMSPERFKGQCDNRADVYSLGLTLYELLVLKPAFESPDRLKLIDFVTKKEVTSPRSIDSRVPRDLETIVLKAADKDPRRRYQSADDLADDLRRFIHDEPIQARRTSIPERTIRWSRRNPWLATAMSVAILALVAVAGVSTYSAQAQSRLNEQLEEKQGVQEQLLQEQRELNEQLQLAADVQKKTNEDLAETNRTNEELMRDLKRSTATLAEKQADFVAERGEIAEAMHWLARSYELSEGEDQNLLGRLSITAQQMPNLSREIFAPLPAADITSLEQMRELVTPQPGGQGFQIRDEFRPLVAAVFARSVAISSFLVASDQGMLGVITDGKWADKELRESMRFWDLAHQRWTGPVLREVSNVIHHAIDPDNNLVAVMMVKPGESTDPEQSADSSDALGASDSPEFILRLEVRSLVSGELLFDTETEPGGRGIGGLGRSQLRFIDNGGRLIMILPGERARSDYIVEAFDCQSWESSHEEVQLKWTERNSFGSRPRLDISRDGRRLIFFSRPPSPRVTALAQGRPRRGYVACFDRQTGQQVGQQIPIDRSTPLITTDDASRVAIVTGIGGQRRIEIRDFESGEQVGESIDLSAPLQLAVRLLNISADQSKMIVAYSASSQRRRLASGTDEQDEQQTVRQIRSYVQIFELETGQSVTPRMSAHGQVESAYFSNQDQTLTVRDASGIRVWDLTGSTLQPILLPNLGPRGLVRHRSNPQSPTGPSAFTFTLRPDGLMTTAANQQVVMARIGGGVRLTAWDGRTGRMLREHNLPDVMTKRADGAPVSISPGGSFLLIDSGRRETDNFRIGQVWRTDPVELLVGTIRLKRNASMKAISPDGEWIAVASSQGASRAEPTDDSRPSGPESGQGSRVQGPGPRRSESVEPNQTAENEPQSTFEVGVKLVNRLTGQERNVPFSFRTSERRDVDTIEIAFSANGSSLSVGRSGSVEVFDLTSESIRRLSRQAIGLRQAGRLDGPGRGFSRGGEHPIRAINHDATMIADVIDQSALRIRQVATRQTLGELMFHPAPITAACFGMEGKTVVTSCEDGLVRQWSLPETWSGTPEEIRQRVEQHTGFQLGDAEIPAIKQLVESEEVGAEWSNQFGELQQSLSRAEREALDLRNRRDWAATVAALEKWQTLHPDNWLPAILKIRPLIEQQKLGEAKVLFKNVSEDVDPVTLGAWIRAEFSEQVGSQQNRSNFGKANNVTVDQASALRWRHESLLEISQSDPERADHLLVLAKVDEVEFRFDEAVEHINQAIELTPDSPIMHFYRAHLMSRLGRWDEALESRIRVMRLEPDDHGHYFKVLSFQLFLENEESFWKVWREMRDKWADSDVARAPQRLAKPAIILGQPGEELEQALQLADLAYGQREGSFGQYDIQVKGLAELRRGELELKQGNAETAQKHFEDALVYTQKAYSMLVENDQTNVIALAKFQEAMILHYLERHNESRTAYLVAVDHHNAHQTLQRPSTTSTFTDWLLNESIKRMAEQLLEIDEADIGLPLPDTKDWETIFEDRFDGQEFADDWHVLGGDWKIEEGAARGKYTGRDYREFKEAAIDLDFEVPEMAEIEYESWWPRESCSELRLLPAINLDESRAFTETKSSIVGLSGFEHPARKSRTWSGYGSHLIDYSPAGIHWMDSSLQQRFLPRQKYRVRVLQQPKHISVFLDDGTGEIELFKERVAGTHGKFVRLYGLGTPGDFIYFDNLKIRAPKSD